MTDFINNPVFICGHPKAGTSLLTALLDGHPAIVAYPEETLFFRRFLPAIEGKAHDDQIALAEKLLIHIFEWTTENPPAHQKDYPDRDYSDLSYQKIKEKMVSHLSKPPSNPAGFLNAAVQAFGEISGLMGAGSQLWVEKTPYNEFHTDRIFRWWSKAKCLHIVRDPRDNFVSYVRKHPDWNAKGFARNWKLSTRAGLANIASFGDQRYRMIRFEDLLTSPDVVMGQIADFLNIKWHDNLLQPTRVGDTWRGNSMFSEKYQAISTAPIGRWQSLITAYDLTILQIICGQLMNELDYLIAKADRKQFTPRQKIEIAREKIIAMLAQD